MYKALFVVNSSIVAVKEVNGFDVNLVVKHGPALTLGEAVAVITAAVKDGMKITPWEFTSLDIKAKIIMKERVSGAKDVFINAIDEDGYMQRDGRFHISMYGKLNEGLFIKTAFFLQAVEEYFPAALKEAREVLVINKIQSQEVQKWEKSADLSLLLGEELAEEVIGE